MTGMFVTRSLPAACFTDIGTPEVKSRGVVEVWCLFQVARPDVVEVAVSDLTRGWTLPRRVLAVGMFESTESDDGAQVAPGPCRVRLLLPTSTGRVALYTARDQLLDFVVDTTQLVPATHPATESVRGWS